MRTLRKVDIESMERELEVLKVNQQKMVRGGDGGVDGFCFFNCLGYLSSYYNCGNDASYYATEYGQAYGFGEVITGELNSGQMSEFVNSMFNTTGASDDNKIIRET